MKRTIYTFLSSLLVFTTFFACEQNGEKEDSTPASTEVIAEQEEETGQPNPYPSDANWQADSKAFVQEGQKIIKELEGDFDKDKLQDKVLVLENPESAAKGNNLSPVRSLVILQANPDGQYRLWASNDRVVLCEECGGTIGDPFRDVIINDNIITIKHDGGSRERWTRNISLALDDKTQEWMIAGDNLDVVDTYDPNNTRSENLLNNGQVPLKGYDVYSSQ